MSLWLNIFIHTDYIEYVIEKYVFLSFCLNIINTFMLSVLYSLSLYV